MRNRFGIVILAAGVSSRMKQPKLLLPWDESSILGYQLRAWRDLRAGQIAVLCRVGDLLMQEELDRLNLLVEDRIINHHPELGMMGSIRCAAWWPGWYTELTHWVIALGDQPHIRPETYRTLLDFATTQPGKICQPRFQNRLFHPVVLPRKLFLELRESPANTLKDFLKSVANDVAVCEVADPGLDFDIDTPADYERARAEFLRPD